MMINIHMLKSDAVGVGTFIVFVINTINAIYKINIIYSINCNDNKYNKCINTNGINHNKVIITIILIITTMMI